MNIKNNKPKVLLVDGSSMLSTGFYATVPKSYMFSKTEEQREASYAEFMKSPSGEYTNGVYMFFKTLLPMIKKHGFTHIAVGLDRSRKSTFRRQLSPEYKANRKDTPTPLKSQFKLLTNVLEEIGIPVFSHPEYEADDLIASIAKKLNTDNPRTTKASENLFNLIEPKESEEPQTIMCYIWSKDNDLIQCVNEHTLVWQPTNKAKDMYEELGFTDEEIKMFNIPAGVFEFTPIYVKHFKGVTPIQIIDLKAIEGDKSDNIKGVQGVGPKASIPLINEYGSLEAIYEAIEGLDDKEQKELAKFFKESLGISRSPIKNLLANREDAFLSKTLATINTEVPDLDNLTLNDLVININKAKAKEVFSELGMKSLLSLI